MLTLYHAPRSRSSRILWLLEELGVPYDVKIVSIRRGDGSGAEDASGYRRVHPHAKVPAIQHDGATVFETPAIALYLTDAFPQAELSPGIGDKQRGPYLSWLAYSTGVIEPAVTMKLLNVPHRYGTFGWGPLDEVEGVLARTIEAGPYLLGEKFSAADIVIGGSIAQFVQWKVLPALPVFTDYAQRITARPAYARAQAKDQG